MASDKDPLIGRTIADRYQVLELIGEGGMGRVYVAEHVRMGRKSAVKVMSPNLALSADAISRFNREASNACKINHPNVAQIYDFGETSDGMLYLAMEFVEGETLRSMIMRNGPLSMARAAGITKQVADALAAAHHLGIVHRDLKPDNIMIARHHDGTDWVKVVDFGIAKTVQGSGESGSGSQTVTTAGVSLGTPEYMSPEQLAGERLDSRTDLYSLGLVLFNMLTADLPYPRVTSKETLVRRLTSKPHTLAEMAPDGEWPPALQAALDRALAPETTDRYASVTDFARDVSAAVAGVGDKTLRISAPTERIVTAPSVSPQRLAAKKVDEPSLAKKPAMIAAGILLVLVSIGGGAMLAIRQSRADAVPPTTPAPTPAPAVAPIVADTTPVKRPVTVAATKPKPTPTAPPQATTLIPSDKRARLPDSATTAAATAAAGPRLRHNWLRANGDSGEARTLPANATDAERVRYFVQEIRAHAVRASTLMAKGNAGGARSEFRDAGSEMQMLRTLYPGAADSLHLDMQLRQAGLHLIQECTHAVADSTKRFPPNFTCDQLLPGLGRGRQAGRGFQRPPRP